VRNQEAARYARWAAIAAGGIAVLVIGIYSVRAISAARRRSAIHTTVSSAVQQQTHTFSYSGMEGNRTIYTIRASQATQFKEGNPALLKDVWITIYGRDGDRNDNIHTRECSYEGREQKTGMVRCAGDVSIDLQGRTPGQAEPVPQVLQIKTSNLTFDGQTGQASTPAPVEFSEPQGHGRGVGLWYSTKDAIVRVEKALEFEMAPSEHTGGLAVNLTAASLEVRRNDRVAILTGPVRVQEGDRELLAQRLSVWLDASFHAQHVIAEGRPSVKAGQDSSMFEVSAASFEGFVSPEGWVQRIVADGDVNGSRKTMAASDGFSCQHAEFSFAPTRNVLRDMTASGNVVGESHSAGVSQNLKTTSLRVKFAPGSRADEQRVESAETLGPATIDSSSSEETTQLHASQFTAQLDATGHLSHLVGGPDVEVWRRSGNSSQSSAQSSTAQFLTAQFSKNGQWTTVEEKGDVNFQQGDRRASASYAKIDQAADRVTLTGSPVISDAESRTSAEIVTIGQKSGQILAEHGVVSTYVPAAQGSYVSLGSGIAHISADMLAGSTSSGRVVYTGHARLWQGESVLEADRIIVSREEEKLEANGNVTAVFPQASSPSLQPASRSKPGGLTSGSNLWHLRAPQLTYWNQQGRALLQGGVKAVSEQGSLESRTLELHLGSAPSGAAENATAASSPGSRQLSSAVARGDVVVRQADRRGSAETAEYTAADGKFVLFGGRPTITDTSGNTITGRSLTFFVANDTISIDSQEGSRTFTRHRVEK
jgi:LPS export ABC transporter protein LptC